MRAIIKSCGRRVVCRKWMRKDPRRRLRGTSLPRNDVKTRNLAAKDRWARAEGAGVARVWSCGRWGIATPRAAAERAAAAIHSGGSHARKVCSATVSDPARVTVVDPTRRRTRLACRMRPVRHVDGRAFRYASTPARPCRPVAHHGALCAGLRCAMRMARWRYRLARGRWPSTGVRGGWRAMRRPTPRHRSTAESSGHLHNDVDDRERR